VQPVLDHKRCDRRGSRSLDGGKRIWTHTVQQLPATAAGLGVVLQHFIHPLDRAAAPARIRDGPAASPLAATAFTAFQTA